ncbi:MAG: alpha/beta hydrolase-fold protein, partial [Betaproteobacteria bacterium]
MALKRPAWPQGRTVILEHNSVILADNALGDPHQRKLAVWLPPQYDEALAAGHTKGERFPVLYDLVGFMGSGLSHINWRNLDENIPERAARLIHEGKMGPTIIVFPDCFTALGGNQYINSSAIGNYADYLTKELIPFVDREFRTLASREHRGCFGKSSGGYGAIIHGMKYAKYWGAIASHSGDAYFDFVYMHDWPNTLTELMKHRKMKREAGAIKVVKEEKRAAMGMDDGRVKNFLDSVWKKEKLSETEGHTLMILAMAASYDPDTKAPLGFRLPFNLETGERIEQRWKQWQKHDPIELVAKYAVNLKTLKGIFVDCGWRDQYHIHYGARILSKRLTTAKVKHTYEEFDDTHS